MGGFEDEGSGSMIKNFLFSYPLHPLGHSSRPPPPGDLPRFLLTLFEGSLCLTLTLTSTPAFFSYLLLCLGRLMAIDSLQPLL